jgi:transmembrane sensor
MGKSRFIELMAKSIGKSATKEELEELELFLDQFPEYKKVQSVANALEIKAKQPEDIFQERNLNAGLAKLWDNIGELELDYAKASAGNKLGKTEMPQGNYKVGYRIWTAAAAVLVACLTGFYFYLGKRSASGYDAIVMNSIYVPYGKTRELTLPDGTKVKLNSGSTITWPQSFAKNSRTVTLKGEGFFEVTKNPKRPFLVVTDQITIKVLGTVFNVKAYDNDKNTETTLLKGKVQVQLKDKPEKNIILLPNEKLIVMNESFRSEDVVNHKEARTEYQLKKLPDIKPEDILETAWLSNRLEFTNESFEAVAKQMERKYNVQLVFDDQALKTEQLSGVLEKESLENALRIIQMTTPFKFKAEGRTIHMRHQ